MSGAALVCAPPPRETGILFKGPLVRAILAGTKTQTRRLVTVPWKGSRRALPYAPYFQDYDGRLVFDDDAMEDGQGQGWVEYSERVAPYGRPGDRLWVRETMKRRDGVWRYAADDAQIQVCSGDAPSFAAWRERKVDTCVSIHMPRWACRLVLEITDVRVERLHAITEADAVAEGVHAMSFTADLSLCATDQFKILWNRINGERAPWHANPWVWRLAFRSPR